MSITAREVEALADLTKWGAECDERMAAREAVERARDARRKARNRRRNKRQSLERYARRVRQMEARG